MKVTNTNESMNPTTNELCESTTPASTVILSRSLPPQD